MSSGSDPIILYGVGAAVVAELIVLILWCIALIRVRRAFLAVILFSTVLDLAFAGLNAVMVYDAGVVMRLFKTKEQYDLFYRGLVCLQSAAVFIFIIGQVWLVRWMVKVSRPSPTKSAAVIDRLI